MKEYFIKRMQIDNPGIGNDEAGNIFNEIYPYYKYMRGAEYDFLIQKSKDLLDDDILKD